MLTFEKAIPADAWILTQVSERAFHSDIHHGAPGPKPGGPPGYNSDLWQIWMMTAGEYYKILRHNRVVGGIVVRMRGYQFYEVVRIFVDPDVQNQGIGTKTFEFLWQEYPEVKKWTLGTPAWNNRTPNFYRKVGFVEVGKDAYGGILFERQLAGR